MKKKYLAPVAIALIATIGITTVSCGKPADEEVNATEAEVTTTVESTEETTAPETTETETTVEETTVAETTKEETTPATESASNKTAKNTETKAAPKAEPTKAATKNETKAETKAAPKAEAPKAPAPAQAAPAPTQAPAHEHQWKEHKATRQEWVSNIVSVPDYETREQTFTFFICNCGAEFRADDSSFAAHAGAHILAGEPDNYRNEVRVIGTETVQVGSHDEDQGYYQNVEYTDYHYCDCGATK